MSSESHAQPDRRRSGRVILVAIVAIAVLIGLGTVVVRFVSDDETSASKGMDKVTYLTGFDISGHESYVHLARDKGYFAEENIEVTIKPGQAGPYNDNAVIAGRAQFASVDSSGAIVRFARTKPAERTIQAISAIQHQTLVSLVTFEDRGIAAPRDLPGHKFGVGPGAAPKVLWPLYAKNSGIDPASVTWAENQPKALAGLLVANQVDAIGLYVASVPGVEAAEAKAAKAAGRAPRKITVLPFSDVIPDMPGSVLITNTKLIKSNPDLVRRFNKALMRGLQHMVEQPGEAADNLHKTDPKYVAAAAKRQVESVAPYARPPAGRPYGYMEPGKVARAIALMQNIPDVPSFLPAELVNFDFVPGAEKNGAAQ